MGHNFRGNHLYRYIQIDFLLFTIHRAASNFWVYLDPYHPPYSLVTLANQHNYNHLSSLITLIIFSANSSINAPNAHPNLHPCLALRRLCPSQPGRITAAKTFAGYIYIYIYINIILTLINIQQIWYYSYQYIFISYYWISQYVYIYIYPNINQYQS